MMYKPTGEFSVEIYSWALFKFNKENEPPSYHLAGIVGGDGRVCSPLQSYNGEDEKYHYFTSRSGKLYKVLKGSDRDGLVNLPNNAKYVFNYWVAINKGTAEDATIEEFKESLK